MTVRQFLKEQTEAMWTDIFAEPMDEVMPQVQARICDIAGKARSIYKSAVFGIAIALPKRNGVSIQWVIDGKVTRMMLCAGDIPTWREYRSPEVIRRDKASLHDFLRRKAGI